MSRYFFILGNTPSLSIAEILSVFPDAKPVAGNEEFLAVELTDITEPQKTLDRLGGTIKIYEAVPSRNGQVNGDDLGKILADLYFQKTEKRKLAFAVNVFGKKDKQLQKELILGAKKHLRAKDVSCRFVNQDFKNITSVQSFHEHLIDKGIELGIFFSSGSPAVGIGKLVASQNIEQYSERDYGKPERNMKIGLMPPKLAQMLISLTGLPSGKTIYDPFCGTGGILSEGLMIGYKCFGSDIQEHAVDLAKKNIEWLIKQQHLDPKYLNNIFIQDATKFDKVSFPFDAIVTENYLGPVTGKPLPLAELEPLEEELSRTYLPFFERLQKRITEQVPVVICFPVFYHQNQAFSLSKTLARILELGYTASALLPETVQKQFGIATTQRNSILYHREGQLVGREVFRLYKTKTEK